MPAGKVIQVDICVNSVGGYLTILILLAMLARSGQQLGVLIDVVVGYILHIIMSVGHNVGLRFPYQVSHPRMRILNEKAMEYLDYECSPRGPSSILRLTNIQNVVPVLKSPHLSRGTKCV